MTVKVSTSSQLTEKPVLEALVKTGGLSLNDARNLSQACSKTRGFFILYLQNLANRIGITAQNEKKMLQQLRHRIGILADFESQKYEDAFSQVWGYPIRQAAIFLAKISAPMVKLSQLSSSELASRSKQRDFLLFANLIAEGLSKPRFTDVSEAKAFLEDPNSQTQLDTIISLNLSNNALIDLPDEIGKLRQCLI